MSGHIIAKWIPSYSGISGEEGADILAKRKPQMATLNQSYAEITHPAVKQNLMNNIELEEKWWRIQSPAS